MRIDRIETHILRYPDPNDAGGARMTLLARVTSADGITGWGEGIAMWPEACRAARLLIDEGLAPMLTGAGDLTVAEAWRRMRDHTWWYGRGGIAGFAIAAIDIALWDIDARARGLPLYRLLGGARRPALPAFAANHVNKATVAENVAEVAGFAAEGYRGVKLGLAKKGRSTLGHGPADEVTGFVAALRAELGPDFEILVDCGNGVRWDLATAIRAARAMAEHDVGWIEEPFPPERLGAHARLRAAQPIPVAMGERGVTASDYAAMIAAGAADVLGVDPARVEGISGFREIDALAGRHGLTINAHAWSTAVTTAASLHLSIASDNTKLFEFKPFPVEVQTALVAAPIRPEAGAARPPEAPGLGIEIDEAVLARLSGGSEE